MTVLPPLLVDHCGQPIGTVEQWLIQRREVLQRWEGFLAYPVQSAGAPSFQVLDADQVSGVLRRRIRYEVEPGCSAEAYLLTPPGLAEPRPGVIVFHSTVPETIRQPAGIEGEPAKAFGLQLARRGYVALCPRCFLWDDGHRRFFSWRARRQIARLRRRLGPVKGISKMIHDARIALDLLCTLPDVDSQRIGAVGHSLGAKQVLYLAALDERVRVSVSSEGGIGRTFSNWSAPWYLGRTSRTEVPLHEHHELLGLIAPRPFLLIGGESADGSQSLPFIDEAATVYRLYGQEQNIEMFNHRQGHCVPEVAGQRIHAWFDRHLKA